MSLTARPIRVSDLPQCADLAVEPVVNLAGSKSVVVNSFSKLLERNSLIGVTVAEGGTVLGFATVIAISDALLKRVLSLSSPGFLRLLFSGQASVEEFLTPAQMEVVHHQYNPSAPFTTKQIADSPCADGINLMSTFSGWTEHNLHVKDLLATSLDLDVTGLRVGSYYKELYSQRDFDEFSRFFGLPHKRTAPEGRILAGLTRSEWEVLKNPVQPINKVFGVGNPTVYLTEAERRVVQASLELRGAPERKVALRLGTSGVKDHKESIMRKVLDDRVLHRDSGFPDSTKSPTRGEQRWHVALELLASHPENFRPWANMPEQVALL